MTYKKKTALEKLHESRGFPKVEKITGKMSKRWSEGHNSYIGPDRSQ